MMLDFDALLRLLESEIRAMQCAHTSTPSRDRLAPAVPPRGRLVRDHARAASTSPGKDEDRGRNRVFPPALDYDSAGYSSRPESHADVTRSQGKSVESKFLTFEMFFEPELADPQIPTRIEELCSESAPLAMELELAPINASTPNNASQEIEPEEGSQANDPQTQESGPILCAGEAEEPLHQPEAPAPAIDPVQASESFALARTAPHAWESDEPTDAAIATVDSDLLPSEPQTHSAEPVKSGFLTTTWAWLLAARAKAAGKRMRLQETVSLGDKRILALLEIDGRRFLVGGGSSGVSLLAQLDAERDFTSLVRQKLESN